MSMTEAEYFQSDLFIPVQFHGRHQPRDEASRNLTEEDLDHGLNVLVTDFADDVRETLRSIRHFLIPGDNLVEWIDGRFLFEPAANARVLQEQLFQAPLDRAKETLSRLQESAKKRLVILIDLSEFSLEDNARLQQQMSEIVKRMLALQDSLQRHRQVMIVGVPRNCLLIPQVKQLMEKAAQEYSSAPLFGFNVPDRRSQLKKLLDLTGLSQDFKDQVETRLSGKPSHETAEDRDFGLPDGSFVCCNSNALIYRMVTEIKEIGEDNEHWQEKLAKRLSTHAIWDPAIRLFQYTQSDLRDHQVPIPVDICPDSSGVISGYLDCAEQIPLAVKQGVLKAEGGGGKTTVLGSLARRYSLPRTNRAKLRAAWLPLEVSEDLKPQAHRVREILEGWPDGSLKQLSKIISSPLYLLIDDVDKVSEEVRKLLVDTESHFGVLLAHRTHLVLKSDEAFRGMRDIRLRGLSPELAEKVSGKPLDAMLATWAMIGMPHSRLCQNPFVLGHCAKALLRKEEPEDRAVADILTESLEQNQVISDAERRARLINHLLPLVANYCLRERKPSVDEQRLRECLDQASLLDTDYDVSWLNTAAQMNLMVSVNVDPQAYTFRHAIHQDYFAARYLADAKNSAERSNVLESLNGEDPRKRWYGCLQLMIALLDETALEQVVEQVCDSDNPELLNLILSGLKPSQLNRMTLDAAQARILGKPKNQFQRRLIESCKAATQESLTAIGPADPRILPLTLTKTELENRFNSQVCAQLESARWGTDLEWGGVHFQLSKYLVTNLEFHEFVRSGGYDRERGSQFWGSRAPGLSNQAGEQWLSSTQPDRPRYWAAGDNRFLRQPNCPVVGITFYEAEAYCRWLSDRDRCKYRLPGVAEWTYAAYARWPGLRPSIMSVLPGGQVGLFPGLASFQVAEVKEMIERLKKELDNRGPAPVGIVHDCKSECSDLFGNVWEWCQTPHDHRLYVRGGPRSTCTLSSLLFDGTFLPDERLELVGFRILRERDAKNE